VTSLSMPEGKEKGKAERERERERLRHQQNDIMEKTKKKMSKCCNALIVVFSKVGATLS